MFTLEESALLGRMLRTTGVIILGILLVLTWLLVRAYAAPGPKPVITHAQPPPHYVPAHRHPHA
jgi:hypothetical protein